MPIASAQSAISAGRLLCAPAAHRRATALAAAALVCLMHCAARAHEHSDVPPHAHAAAPVPASVPASSPVAVHTADGTTPANITADAGGTLAEVRVHASALDTPLAESATPAHLLDSTDLLHRRTATLGETLEGLPGVRNNHYGAGAGRPVIRGADAARVRILLDGSEVQDASTSSPDHAVGLEPMLAREVEVLRGPSTLLYGGGITGGVVNVRDSRIPDALPATAYEGRAELRHASNGRERSGLFALTAGIPLQDSGAAPPTGGPALHNAPLRAGTSAGASGGGTGGGNTGIVVHVQGLRRTTSAYRPGTGWDGGSHVLGSDHRSGSASLGASLVHERGYLGVAYSRLRSQYGLPGHSHEYEECHPHGNTLHCGSDAGSGVGSGAGPGTGSSPGTVPPGCHRHGTTLHCPGSNGHGEDSHSARVDLRSDRWDLRGQWRDLAPGISRVRLAAGLTDYRHDEIEHGTIGTTFANRAHDARLELEHQPLTIGPGTLRGVAGVQHSRRRFSAIGHEAYVEPTDTRSRALFALQEYRLGAQGQWRLEWSGRYEWQTARLYGTHRRGTVRHGMGSFSLGASWHFVPGHVLAASTSRSERAPTAEELFANGIHLATNTWERGNPRLRAERAHHLDVSLRKTTGAVRYDISLYHNLIHHYIHARTTARHEGFRLIDYRQRDARLRGLEARLTWQASPQWRLGLSGDMVQARLQSRTGHDTPVPRMPAHRLGLDAHWHSGAWSASAHWYRSFAQHRIARHETPTPAYSMLHLHLQWHLPAQPGQPGYRFYASVHNALNRLAYHPTSFVKEASPVRGRSLVVGLQADF